MPRHKTSLSQLGVVETHKRSFRAHIQFRSDVEAQMHICGPNRDTEPEAQKDLDQIRAAGGVGSTREETVEIMEAESKRIKISCLI